MKKLSIALIVLLTIVQTTVEAQKIQRRYKRLSAFIFLTPEEHKGFFEIYPTVLTQNQVVIKTPTKPRTIFDLDEKAQKQLLTELTTKSTDLKILQEAIKEPLEKVDVTKVKELEKRMRVVSSEVKKTFNIYVKRVLGGERVDAKTNSNVAYRNDRADRVENLKVMVTLDPTCNLKFLTWDKLKNQDTTINLGQISLNTTFEAAVTGSFGIKNTLTTESSGESTTSNSEKDLVDKVSEDLITSGSKENTKTTGIADASASISPSAKFTRSLQAARQFMNKETMFSGYFEPKRFFIDLLSLENDDLVGSTFITLTCKYEGDYKTLGFTKFENLSTDAGLSATADVRMYQLTVAYPDVPNDIIARVNYSFLYRNVLKPTHKWYPEFKQKISYLYGSTFQRSDEEKPAYVLPVGDAYTNVLKDDDNMSAGRKAPFNLSVVAIKANEFKPTIYNLISDDNIFLADASDKKMNFETQKEAFDLLAYLKVKVIDTSNLAWINGTFKTTPVGSNPLLASDWLKKSISTKIDK